MYCKCCKQPLNSLNRFKVSRDQRGLEEDRLRPANFCTTCARCFSTTECKVKS